MIGDYVLMRFIGVKLAFLLDTSDGIISLYKGAYGDSAPRFLNTRSVSESRLKLVRYEHFVSNKIGVVQYNQGCARSSVG